MHALVWMATSHCPMTLLCMAGEARCPNLSASCSRVIVGAGARAPHASEHIVERRGLAMSHAVIANTLAATNRLPPRGSSERGASVWICKTKLANWVCVC